MESNDAISEGTRGADEGSVVRDLRAPAAKEEVEGDGDRDRKTCKDTADDAA
jgi:hypothetical protein